VRVRGALIPRVRPFSGVRSVGHAAAVLLGCLLVSATLLHAAGGPADLGPPPPSAAAPFSGTSERADVLLARVYASAARDDEFVELVNVRADGIGLGSWSLSDGEAVATFPPEVVLPPGGRIVVTRNSTSYAEDLLAAADFTWDRGDARQMEGGVLRLADDGDEVFLTDPSGTLVDVLVFGDSPYAGPGWMGPPARSMGRGEIAVRRDDPLGFPLDRDDATDWDGPRVYRLGQSNVALDPVASSGPISALVLVSDEGSTRIPLSDRRSSIANRPSGVSRISTWAAATNGSSRMTSIS